RVEVDEDFAAQQIVHRVLARGVEAHELLDRRRLVHAVVVDVHVRMTLQPLVEEVDQLLERSLLRDAVMGPERLVSVAREKTEQKMKTARRLRERIALDIEHHVAGRGPWEEV